ncbi:cupredoxin domain-containing protein [Hoyosella rhizosphaerae]|uniref:Blue (type 1) copper domain-containing protein n=1 Tax=Hoyosella rhizosphaerae TaxID=1755582 RepID=A0A916U4Q2_9ACTN|nr:plastocyanin/azurin family copper-binding protein [Hoyosella rhizosphaerae]MBN4926661.1 cupredoxin domain-containing protein [Hoyosella rhizosphaerae]GGC57462.1 hypothetical protein GCM10011410_07470 [Hoyosella rhizosphaerae]
MRKTLSAVFVSAAIVAAGCATFAQDPESESTGIGSPVTTEEAQPSTAQPSTAQPTTAPATTSPAPVQRTIDIAEFRFTPGDITVPRGSTITWVQQDNSLHTVDFDDGVESGDMTQGDTYARTFTEPGTYTYVCFYHPRMVATVIVE